MSWAYERRLQAQKKLRYVERGKLLQRTDPLATAFHESAHAVFSEGFGMPVEWVTCFPVIENGERFLGYAKTKGAASGPLSTVKVLAGDIAEYPLIFGRDYTFEGYMSGSDAGDLAEILIASGVKDFEPVRGMAEDASQLVQETKHWIEAVALELFAFKTIQGDGVRNVLRKLDFYTPQNPLFKFYSQCWLLRMISIAQIGGIDPPTCADGNWTTENVIPWLLKNVSAIQRLMLDKDANWNKLGWGDNAGGSLADEELKELATCSKIMETFGLSNLLGDAVTRS